MAQSVVRYLVVNHNIPVYRIYTVGMGNAQVQDENGNAKRVRGGRVEVSLLRNGVSELEQAQNSMAPSSVPVGTQNQGTQMNGSTMQMNGTTTVQPSTQQNMQPATTTPGVNPTSGNTPPKSDDQQAPPKL